MARGRKLTAKEQERKLASDKNERKKIFNELLTHLRAGYSLNCFSALSEKSILEYLRSHNEEFVQEDFNKALREGQAGWEQIGRRQANGECLGNSRSWYYNMANRYGWREKIDIEAEHKGQISVNIIDYATQKRVDNNSRDG